MSTANSLDRQWSFMNEELTQYTDSARRFIAHELANRETLWSKQGFVDADIYPRLAQLGYLLTDIPETYGGMGSNFYTESIFNYELMRAGVASLTSILLVNAIAAHYIVDYGTAEQKAKWLPALIKGEIIGAIAMTEPSAGSDLQNIRSSARREGDDYVLNGSKTFISNGHQAGLVVVVCKTNPHERAKGISLLLVEGDTQGFSRGRMLEKVGLHGQDTAELFFDNCRVPVDNLLGGVEGQGFYQLMSQLPRERLYIAISGLAMMEAALDDTVAYTKNRQVFGQSLFELQNTRFVLANCQAQNHVGRLLVDDCIKKYVNHQLDAATAAMAKLWISDNQCKVVDDCLQLFGGYGYMTEYPIARMYLNMRVQRIYGGTNEIMKEVIARTL